MKWDGVCEGGGGHFGVPIACGGFCFLLLRKAGNERAMSKGLTPTTQLKDYRVREAVENKPASAPVGMSLPQRDKRREITAHLVSSIVQGCETRKRPLYGGGVQYAAPG